MIFINKISEINYWKIKIDLQKATGAGTLLIATGSTRNRGTHPCRHRKNGAGSRFHSWK